MIYVDEIRDHENGKWCHMFADKESELHAFARRLGLKTQWSHVTSGLYGKYLHYDLRPNVRARAIREGAKEITARAWLVKQRVENTIIRGVHERLIVHIDQAEIMGDMLNKHNFGHSIETREWGCEFCGLAGWLSDMRRDNANDEEPEPRVIQSPLGSDAPILSDDRYFHIPRSRIVGVGPGLHGEESDLTIVYVTGARETDAIRLPPSERPAPRSAAWRSDLDAIDEGIRRRLMEDDLQLTPDYTAGVATVEIGGQKIPVVLHEDVPLNEIRDIAPMSEDWKNARVEMIEVMGTRVPIRLDSRLNEDEMRYDVPNDQKVGDIYDGAAEGSGSAADRTEESRGISTGSEERE